VQGTPATAFPLVQQPLSARRPARRALPNQPRPRTASATTRRPARDARYKRPCRLGAGSSRPRQTTARAESPKHLDPAPEAPRYPYTQLAADHGAKCRTPAPERRRCGRYSSPEATTHRTLGNPRRRKLGFPDLECPRLDRRPLNASWVFVSSLSGSTRISRPALCAGTGRVPSRNQR
jgi:hypothetical protein